jgi:hypothetical protein
MHVGQSGKRQCSKYKEEVYFEHRNWWEFIKDEKRN